MAVGRDLYYQPPLPFEGVAGEWSDPVAVREGNRLEREMGAHRDRVMSRVTEALVHHETSQGRSRLARHLAPERADAVLASLVLDYAVLPRGVVEGALARYVGVRDAVGECDERMEALNVAYRAATGWCV